MPPAATKVATERRAVPATQWPRGAIATAPRETARTLKTDGLLRRRLLAAVGGLLAAALLPASAVATSGDRDGSFGRFGTIPYESQAVAATSDGSAIVLDGGLVDPADRIIRKLRPDGTLDQSFGSGGAVAIAQDGTAGEVLGIAVDSEDRLLVAENRPGDQGQLEIYRFDPNGQPDSSFGTNGILATGTTSTSGITDIAVDGSDRIYFISGSSETSMNRLREDGEPDLGYGTGGSAPIAPAVPASDRNGFNLFDIRADGSAVVAGPTRGNPDYGYFLTQLEPDGSPLAGFGSDGLVRHAYNSSVLKAVAAGPGRTAYVSDEENLSRYRADGSRDLRFARDPGGKDLPHWGARDLAVDRSGKIYYATDNNPFYRRHFPFTTSIYRFNADGSLDRSFGARGRTFIYGAGARPAIPRSGIPGYPEPWSGFRMALDQRSGTLTVPGLFVSRLKLRSPQRDIDGDGFADRRDRCRWLPAAAHRGCPLITTEATIAVYGAPPVAYLVVEVSSTSPVCYFGQSIDLFREGAGREVKVATLKLEGGGRDVRADELKPGTYFARFNGADRGTAGICRPSESQRVRLDR